jgi:hypothetical protein
MRLGSRQKLNTVDGGAISVEVDPLSRPILRTFAHIRKQAEAWRRVRSQQLPHRTPTVKAGSGHACDPEFSRDFCEPTALM